VSEIPQHSRRLVERLLESYCARICPPGARAAVRLSYRIDVDRVTIFELRRICGVPGTQQPAPLAQFRFRGSEGGWRLLTLHSGWWRAYPAEPKVRSFLDWLRELDADPQGRFFTRIDGKSLRWCSSVGRCSDCDTRYCQVLGLQSALEHRSA
jgi:hypothetical protein